jgi:hypothetical protein
VRNHLPALALSVLVGGAVAPAAAGDKGNVVVDQVAFQGWTNNLRLRNGAAELIVTLEVGPRVISYRLADGKNVFKEYPDQLGKSGEKDWQIRGGHRLWVAPEDPKRTYFPDNGPVRHELLPAPAGGGTAVRFLPAPEKEIGIQKEIDLHLEPIGSGVRVVHRLRNVGGKPTELAPWALSVMAPGGVEIIPLPAKRPHPGSPDNARSAEDFWPNQQLILWPFFDFKDPRWTFGSKYLLLRQDRRGPTKLGLAHREGWVGYLNGGTLFVKRFGHDAGATYPDRGANFETFTNEDMLEVETLGPLVRLAPGQAVELAETWELIPGVSAVATEADVDRNVLPRVTAK